MGEGPTPLEMARLVYVKAHSNCPYRRLPVATLAACKFTTGICEGRFNARNTGAS